VIVSVEEIFGADWLKKTFLAGVDLTFDDNTAYPDEMFEMCMLSAFDMMEQTLGIKIRPTDIPEERHDAHDWERDKFWPFYLDHRPVRSVTGIHIRYGSFKAVEIPVSWVQLISKEHGQIHLMPSEESLGSYFFRMGIPLMTGTVLHTMSQIPGYFRFAYSAGFHSEQDTVTVAARETAVAITFEEEFPSTEYTFQLYTVAEDGTKTPVAVRGTSRSLAGVTTTLAVAPSEDTSYTWLATGVPWNLLYTVGLTAAILPLDVAGDLIAGAGIASTSIGTDGLHQSVNTTSSATNSGYGARVLQFEKELKSRIPALRSKYRSLNFGVI